MGLSGANDECAAVSSINERVASVEAKVGHTRELLDERTRHILERLEESEGRREEMIRKLDKLGEKLDRLEADRNSRRGALAALVAVLGLAMGAVGQKLGALISSIVR